VGCDGDGGVGWGYGDQRAGGSGKLSHRGQDGHQAGDEQGQEQECNKLTRLLVDHNQSSETVERAEGLPAT